MSIIVQMLTWNSPSAAVLFNQLDVTLSVLRSPVSDGVENMANSKNFVHAFQKFTLIGGIECQKLEGEAQVWPIWVRALSR